MKWPRMEARWVGAAGFEVEAWGDNEKGEAGESGIEDQAAGG